MPDLASSRRRPREEREQLVLDAAARLFYARGVHEVGMDELIAASGLAKASVYRLYPSKDALIGAYLQRQAAEILSQIDSQIAASPGDPRAAIDAILSAIESDLRRDGFRGCAFNNASIEFAEPEHPARMAAAEYRKALRDRLVGLAVAIDQAEGKRVGAAIALVIDGMYTSAAHLGPGGPAAQGRAVIKGLLDGR